MKVIIEFECDNDAFVGDDDEVCTALESADKLRDSNGNTIGTVKVVASEEHDELRRCDNRGAVCNQMRVLSDELERELEAFREMLQWLSEHGSWSVSVLHSGELVVMDETTGNWFRRPSVKELADAMKGLK